MDMARTIFCLAIVLTAITLGGCQANAKVSPENARLRLEAVELRNKINDLERRNRELEVQLKQASASTGVSDEVLANTPQLTEIVISSLSFANDKAKTGRPNGITIYLDPQDGLGRFMQLAGSVAATVVLLPGGAEPITIGRLEMSPSQVRDAYRSGITGTHYTIEIPIQLPEPGTPGAEEKQALVTLAVTDGHTGQRFSAQRTIPFKP